MKYRIYGLRIKESKSKRIFYVGQTTKALEDRRLEHVREALCYCGLNWKKGEKIRSIVGWGQWVEIVLLDETDDVVEANQLEAMWIKRLSGEGLLNVHPGGEERDRDARVIHYEKIAQQIREGAYRSPEKRRRLPEGRRRARKV